MFYSLQYRSFTFGKATDSKQNRENAYNMTFRTVSLERLAAASGCISSVLKINNKSIKMIYIRASEPVDSGNVIIIISISIL